MNILEQTPNPNFREAWVYVERNYAFLIRDSFLRSITLLDPLYHMPGADGLHLWFGTYAEITVRNGRGYSTAHFVEVLVHELTHLVQCSSGRVRAGMTRDEMEAEAYPAGRNARQIYELQVAEQFARDMQAAQRNRIVKRWAA